MKRHANKSSREPGDSADFAKIALLVFLAILAVIVVARFIVGAKLTALGL